MRFGMLDRITELIPGERITAERKLTGQEDYLADHFPLFPVMPGVLMLEAMAQTAALLSFSTPGSGPSENSVIYFAGIDGARFKRPVEPGDQLIIEVELIRAKAGIYKYKGEARVGNDLACEAELMCTMRTVP